MPVAHGYAAAIDGDANVREELERYAGDGVDYEPSRQRTQLWEQRPKQEGLEHQVTRDAEQQAVRGAAAPVRTRAVGERKRGPSGRCRSLHGAPRAPRDGMGERGGTERHSELQSEQGRRLRIR